MTIPSNIAFSGGSPEQQKLIGDAHNLALQITQKAKQVSATGANTFATWFGTTAPSVVSGRFAKLAQIIGSSRFTYDITNALPEPLDDELVISLESVSGNQLTVLPWKGVFLLTESNVEETTKRAAMTIIHIAAESIGPADDLLIGASPDGARFLATWEPKSAAQSPRNYMYYAGSI